MGGVPSTAFGWWRVAELLHISFSRSRAVQLELWFSFKYVGDMTHTLDL